MSAMPTRRTVLQVVAASIGVIGSAGGAAAINIGMEILRPSDSVISGLDLPHQM
jgi:hypothetical protein